MSPKGDLSARSGIALGPFDGLLFDMDGTILTSIAAVERAWSAWAMRIGAPAADVLSFLHGRRAVDTICHFAPPSADIGAEVRWLDEREHEDLNGVAEVPGARAFLERLPSDRWAVVTSANRALALKRIAAAGLPVPPLLVSSNDVTNGKPDPEGYCLAAKALGINAGNCVVFEDAHSGILAGRAAGAQVVRVAGPLVQNDGPVAATIQDYTTVHLEPMRGSFGLIL
jgi:mannitol-1-/sugar-/sorbitol-6-phosphatase